MKEMPMGRKTEKNRAKKNKAILFIEIACNIGVLILMYLIMWFISYRYNLMTPFLYKKGTAIMIFIYGVLYTMFSSIYDGHKIGHLRVSEIIYSQFLAVLIVNVLSFFQICLIDRRIVDLSPIIILTVLDLIYIIIWAFWTNKRYQYRNKTKKIIVVHGGETPDALILKMKAYGYRFKIASVVNESVGYDALIEMLGTDKGIAISGISSALRKKLVKYCFENSVTAYIIPDTADIIIRGAETVNLLDTPLLLCNNGEISIVDGFIKRVMDLTIAIGMVLIMSPFMLLTAICIKLYDRGPVLFKQNRLTLGGRVFQVYKFRSMVMDAEKDGVARLAKQNDDRITPVGKIIRRLRLDELPQLFNIIKGDMSIVGPRPERPEIAEEYKKTMPEFDYRLKVKAGLTGYAQVLGKYNTTPYDKLMLDMMYIEQYTFFLDLQLILMTLKILFMPESTEGVSQNAITANENKLEL